MTACDCADAFESLGRFEEAIAAAQVDIKNYEIFATTTIQSNNTIGRCQAKLGRPEEATAAFEAAITEAHDCEFPFLELLARRDFIVHVLDAEGRREEQMAGLGDAISRMAMAPGEYTAILGSGIDAEAAVAAFARSATQRK
jgi:tetratricopeptide (TPR) repeat protein